MLRTRRAGAAILTCSPNELVEEIHDRMPVILGPDARGRWLNPTADLAALLAAVAKPYPAAEMKAFEGSPLVKLAKERFRREFTAGVDRPRY